VTTILEFPQAAGNPPRIPDSEATRQVSGFIDLESPLCDVVTMASIAAQIAANARTDDGELIFAVCHLSEMLDALKVKYYAAYNGETAIEPDPA
jgi:hypothetical protein